MTRKHILISPLYAKKCFTNLMHRLDVFINEKIQSIFIDCIWDSFHQSFRPKNWLYCSGVISKILISWPFYQRFTSFFWYLLWQIPFQTSLFLIFSSIQAPHTFLLWRFRYIEDWSSASFFCWKKEEPAAETISSNICLCLKNRYYFLFTRYFIYFLKFVI